MNAQTVGWLVFLAQIINFSCYQQKLFELEDSHLTAKEGSCVEIKCSVSSAVDASGAYWFWMKNAIWTASYYNATIIYSTNTLERPVSPDYANRVKYIGSPSLKWNGAPTTKPRCSILICNLNKTDSGNYFFRFIGKPETQKWVTLPVNLTVLENSCLITFEKPPVINESGTIKLTCSTSGSCPSTPQIRGDRLTEQSSNFQPIVGKKSDTAHFTADWQDDGKEFSCQTKDNEDPHLIRNISITVVYAPKEIVAKISPENVKEGQSVTLTCSAKGHPGPTLTWFKNDVEMDKGAEWEFTPIKDSDSGNYHCKAFNKHGANISSSVVINVTYAPQVEVKMTPPSEVKQGDTITLTCDVKRSNPQPHTYVWLKGGKEVDQGKTYVIERINPEDEGVYKCEATNTVGPGSSGIQINVQYIPRNTRISISNKTVKVGKSLIFTCDTKANPAPKKFSWYRFNKNKPINSLQWTSKTTENKSLYFQNVQRADEACYRCNATNAIDTGDSSEPVCIEVLYPPTIPTLSLSLSWDAEVMEGQLVTISCTVESAPPSMLTLTRTSTLNSQSSERHFPPPNHYWRANALQHAFNVTSAHTGFYTCNAINSEGSNKSAQRKLVVKYRPKDVTVQAQPGLVVNENMQLTLSCIAQSYPELSSVTWIKMTDEKKQTLQTPTLEIQSVSPSDSGLYSCEARNTIGTGKSQQVEVKVKYAPKHTNITTGAVEQQSDGKSFVTLSCSSHSYPPVRQYSWYKKTKVEERDVDEKVSDKQNHTVFSDQPGEYYCIAKNEINQKSSSSVQLFADRVLVKALMFFFLFLLILLIIFLIFFVRSKRNKSIQQGTTNTLPRFGFLGWWNGARRSSLINEPVMAEPFRSRDDLLPDHPYRPKAQRHQPRPDSTPASNINSVYCTVNLPGKQGPSAQVPIRQQGGHTQADSLNYASLHFANKQKNKQTKAEGEVVYAMVSKQKPPKKNEQERLEDYENISTAHVAKNPLNYDSDTSEDEVDLDYTEVNFKPKSGHQRASRDSSSSDEEETQYSVVKI